MNKEIKLKIKGIKGDSPTDEQLVELIKPLIPKPLKGDTGETPTDEKLVELITPLIPEPKDGETPSDDRLIGLIKPLIILPEVKEQMEETPATIVSKINRGKSLIEKNKIDVDWEEYKNKETTVEDVKGLPETIRQIQHRVAGYSQVAGGGTNITLKTNDVANTVQTELNLKAGTNVTLTPDVYGAVTIDATGGGLTNPVDVLEYNTSYTPTGSEPVGSTYWNSTDETVDIKMPDGITLQIGQENQLKVRNNTGATILNGKPVYTTGMLGNRPTVGYARGNVEATSRLLGLLTQDIANNNDGKVTTSGYVRDLNTTGSLYGETWNDGDDLWVSKTVAGGLTNVEPSAPHHSDYVGQVVNAHATQGSILVHIIRHSTLEELSDVNGTPLTTDGQIPTWHNTEGYFDFDKSINDYVPYTGATGDVDLGAFNLSSTRLFTGLGTALLPSNSFIGRTSDGMWSPASGALAWSTVGTERLRITSTSQKMSFASGLSYEVSNTTLFGVKYPLYTPIGEDGSNIGIMRGGLFLQDIIANNSQFIFIDGVNENKFTGFGLDNGEFSLSSSGDFATAGKNRFLNYLQHVSGYGGTATKPEYTFFTAQTYGMSNLGSLAVCFIANGAEAARFDSSKNFGIGTNTISARLHLISTTEQFRSGYSTSQYWNATTSSAGITTFNAVGTTPSFVFSKATTINGDLTLGTAGNKLKITEGTNATVGVATLVAGVVTVNTTAVTANSRIFLTRQTTAGTLGTSVDVTARVAGTSFTITSNGSVLDTSTVAWLIIN